MRKIILLSLLFLGLVSCHQKSNTPIKLNGIAQGTYYSIIYYDNEQRNFQPQIDSLLTEFDKTASLWVDRSLIQRINKNQDSIITPLFADIFNKSLEINNYTNGAFDCRVGQLVATWGFSFKHKENPTATQIDSLLAYSQADIYLDTNENGEIILHKQNPNTWIDFNAIAQGYSSDLVAQWLTQQNIHDYIVDIGGEVIAHGNKPNGDHWTVGVEKPADNKYSAPEIESAIYLDNLAIVTSGNYRKYYEKDGVRYSHTINPNTGYPVEHSLLSASVIDSTSWRADALATACMVMGLEKSIEFINSHPYPTAAYFIYDSNGTYKTYATPEFQKLIIQK